MSLAEYKPKFGFKANLNEIRFALDLAGLNDKRYDPIQNIGVLRDKECLEATVGTTAHFAENTLLPLYNRPEHATHDKTTHIVKLVDGYQDAFKKYNELGLHSISMDEKDGGMGFPAAYDAICSSIMMSANNVFQLTNGLTKSAYLGLKRNAKDSEPGNTEHKLPSSIRDAMLTKLATNEWPGIMVMTEAGHGSYLKDIKTAVSISKDGQPLLMEGIKTYITGGDDDFSKNIIHIVLARFNGDEKPSLFMTTKHPLNEKGDIAGDKIFAGDKSHKVFVSRIEDKMGLDQSATTEMTYHNAECYLIGERQHGQAGMFVLMNEARRMIGRQAYSIAEAAFQQSFKNAVDHEGAGRTQGHAYNGNENGGNKMDPLVVYPQVRELLLRQRSFVEGARALDMITELENELKGRDSKAWVDIMTNVQKYHFTEEGNRSVDHAVQTFGGEGYIKENGIERYLRDIRVTRIYEGSNQIQAISLIRNSFAVEKGDEKPKIKYIEEKIGSFLSEYKDKKYTTVLNEAFKKLVTNAGKIASDYKNSGFDINVLDANAKNFTELLGEVTMGYVWAKTAQKAQEQLKNKDINPVDKLFHETKLATANFHMNIVLNEKINGPLATKPLDLLEIPDAGIRRQDVSRALQYASADISKTGFPKDLNAEDIASARISRANQPLHDLSESEKRDTCKALEQLMLDLGEGRRQDPFSKLVESKLDALKKMRGIKKGSVLSEFLNKSKEIAA